MSDQAPIVLLTRPAAQAAEFGQSLGENANVLISPMLEIRPIEFAVDIDQYTALLFASRNAVMAAARCLDLSGKMAITVGERTAQAARQMGMSAMAANGGADGLISVARQTYPDGKLLFFRGRHTRGQVAETLISLGIDTDFVVSYEQIPLKLNADAQTALRGDRSVLLPLFSPRTTDILSSEVLRCRPRAPMELIAMSQEILAAWAGPEPVVTSIASERTSAAMKQMILGRIERWT